MVGEGLILRFNEFNGKEISIETLKEFHGKVQSYLDSIGSGPYVPALRDIQSRITKSIKELTAKRITVFMAEIAPMKIEEKKPIEKPKEEKLKPIEKPKPLGKVGQKVSKKEKRKEFKPKSHGKAKEIYGLGEIYGLEEIENDSDLQSGLGEINSTVYEVITNRILDLIKGGGLIWRQPWNEKVNGATDLAHNYVTKHQYGAGNFYLNYLSEAMGGVEIVINKKGKTEKKMVSYKHPFYFTFKQVSDLGGKVNSEEIGWPVVYFKWLYKDLKKNILIPKEKAIGENGKLKIGVDRFPGLFYYTVFNYHQCSNLKINLSKAKVKTRKEKIESAEKIVADMPNAPTIKITGKDAWYRRDIDTVQVPPLINFKQEQFFYSVEFHELIHSTGHPSRVNREREMGRKFGDKNYAFEELIAELGSSFLCGESGILYYTMKNSAAYIKGWSTKLVAAMESDPKFYLKAASQAQKAADYILGYKVESEGYKQVAGIKEIVKVRKPIVKTKRVEEKAVPENKSPLQSTKTIHPKEGNADLPKPKLLSGLVDASALAGIDFKEFALTDQYASDFHKLNSDTQVMIWGKPGSGKTVYLLKFAQYLADKLNLKVLYVANEEFGRSTFSQKIKEFNIGHPNLKFTKDATDEMIDQFDAAFFDSINSLGMTLDDYRRLRDKHPNKLFIDIVQSTKDGDFRGGKDWEHEVDIAGEIVNRKLILRKNRLDPYNSEKADALLKDELISEGKKKAEIKQAVKNSLQPSTEQPKAA